MQAKEIALFFSQSWKSKVRNWNSQQIIEINNKVLTDGYIARPNTIAVIVLQPTKQKTVFCLNLLSSRDGLTAHGWKALSILYLTKY